MATFGQGINASLGRIDYSPFLQGASQGAQMRAQGMQQLGAGLAQGLKEYQANKQIASDAIGETEAIIAQSDSVKKWLSDPNNDSKAAKLAKKLQTNGTLGMNDATTLSSSLRSFLKSEQISELKKQQELENNFKRQQIDIQGQQATAELQRANASALAAMNEAKSIKNTPPQLMTLEQLDQFKARGFDVKAVPVGRGMFAVKGIDTFAPPSQTTINTGDGKLLTAIYSDMQVEKAKAENAQNAIAAYNDSMDLLDSGDVFTGSLAEPKLALAKFGQMAFGMDSQTASNTEVLRSRLTDPLIGIAKQLGTNPTDKDLQFILDVKGGRIDLNKETLKRLSELGKRESKRLVDSYNERLNQTFSEDDADSKRARSALKLSKPSTAPRKAPKIKYDKNGKAWTQDENGNVIPYNG